MASTLKLVQGDSGTELDLNVGKSGSSAAVGWNVENWKVQEAGHVEGEKPPLITETMDLLLKGSDHDDLASRKQSMHEMQVYATRYIKDRTFDTPVWLHVQMSGETNERRALVHKISLSPKSPNLDTKGWIDQSVARYQATITREPYWEALSTYSMPSVGAQDWAALYDYTSAGTGGTPAAHNVMGDVPARISFFRLNASSGELGRAWIGVRSDNFSPGGDASNFVPIWECEDGTNNTNETGISDDTSGAVNTASPGSGSGAFVEVTESDLDWDDTWNKCLRLDLYDATTSNFGDQFGLNLWLLRTKVTGGTWEVQLRFGYSNMEDADYIRGNIVEIDSTSWNLYEMGIQRLPIRDYQAVIFDSDNYNYEQSFSLQIWARRVAGSGDLHLDCVCPIPVDEGFLKIWDCDVDSSSESASFGVSPLGNTSANAYTTGPNLTQFFPYAENSFGLPIGDGRMICVFARKSSSNIGDSYVVSSSDEGKYFERWISLRGSK